MSEPRRPERKAFALKLDGPPDAEGRFTGYAAVFNNVDKGNDVIEPGAFTKTLQENPNVPILWAHNPDEPIGVSVSCSEDANGLKVEGQLEMTETPRARSTHALMTLFAEKNVKMGLSIGYRTVKRSFKGQVRHLQELALGEFSPCVFPMNELAGVNDVKGNKWLGQYGATESVDCLLSMIGAGADFLAAEVEEGDTEDAARMQAVLATLGEILTSEIADVATGEVEGEEPDYVVWVEEMRAPVEHAIKTFEALLTREPASVTHAKGAATKDDVEPATATLRALMADIKSA